MKTSNIKLNGCNLQIIMIVLSLISDASWAANDEPNISNTGDTLIISTSKRIINSNSDSLLQLEIVLRNNSKSPIRYFEIYSNSRGEICLPQAWSMIITKVDSNHEYDPPLLLCHGSPKGVLRNNEEYRYNLKMNFKWVKKLNSRPEINQDFGEYSIQLQFKTEKDIINSNTIKIVYKED